MYGCFGVWIMASQAHYLLAITHRTVMGSSFVHHYAVLILSSHVSVGVIFSCIVLYLLLLIVSEGAFAPSAELR